MSKTRTMGKQYLVVVSDNWDNIAEASRATEQLVVSTKSKGFSSISRLEDSILTCYLTPKQNESFADYKSRFIEAFVGTGFRRAITSLLLGGKIPFNFALTKNDGVSTLLVDTITRRQKYQVIISASGEYSDRGASIATGLKELLEKNNVQHTYRSLDRLI